MGYLFLTGATGLLGAYLIRDLLHAGTKLALLVRPTRFASARQRVETLMARWERQAGHSLPRPVVLEGDISRENLGLDATAVDWATRNCGALMHNAASLTFESDRSDNEPYRSNVGGTKNVLEFCRTTGIRQLHHVSTAYVCGLRKDRAFENELDVGQEFGNDYEISKCQSEKLVRDASFLDSLTVYRPGIIVGDSTNGYTSTYHGFYVPLKLVATLIKKTAGQGIPPEMMRVGIQQAGIRLREMLNFKGDERKNYVPVDWVSAMMSRIYTNSALHGNTYHLTPRESVKILDMQQVIEEAIFKSAELTSAEKSSDEPIDWTEFEQFFSDGMSVYESYWRNDPTFDTTNTTAAAPDLPCPLIDEAMMMMMCEYAIDSNFGWPIQPAVRPEFDLHTHLAAWARSAPKSDGSGNGQVYLGLQVNGRGGGQWELQIDEENIKGASTDFIIQQGLSDRATATYYLNSKTFESLSAGQTTVDEAVRTGRVLIEGNGVPLEGLVRVLQSMAVGGEKQHVPSG